MSLALRVAFGDPLLLDGHHHAPSIFPEGGHYSLYVGVAAPSSGRKRPPASARDDDDNDGVEQGVGSSSGSIAPSSPDKPPSPSPRRPSYASLMESDALEEAEAAIEGIVRPLNQPVELLPRAPEVKERRAMTNLTNY